MANASQLTPPDAFAGFPDDDFAGEEAFRIERVGDVAVVVPSGAVETLQWESIEEASILVLGSLRRCDLPLVVVDLSEVDYFGSIFLSLLLRVERSVRKQGGTMVICGVSNRARELLRITNLDTIWAIYESRDEAIRALVLD